MSSRQRASRRAELLNLVKRAEPTNRMPANRRQRRLAERELRRMALKLISRGGGA